jgi:hypothetical protein
LQGLSQRVQLCTWSPNNCGDLPYLTYDFQYILDIPFAPTGH